ncbi:restriction endonuclease subunit S [uncultured Treponema sp.]|uniref:restriction endonuclease subunit S n=1 Tax=uncultured Treponema sp. TaxID=162155 RepID=UPI00259916E2|nr:restriction endonuclease subunit S [uncultured Treponema sp.]
MVEWKEYRIKDLGEVVTGNTPPTSNREYYGTEYKFIKPTDMVEGQRFVSTTEEYYSELAYQKYKKCLLPPKTPCVVTIGSLGKKMCLTDTECFTNQAVNAVIPNKENDGEFLYYAFKASVLAYVKQLDSGTTSGRENVSKSSFSKIKVRVPPLPTQQKIASILSAYDNLIQNYKKQIEALQTAASELYKEWFVRFRFPGYKNSRFENGIPEGWKIERLTKLVGIKYGKDHSKLDDGNIPVYGSGGIMRYCNKALYDKETVLIPRKGSLNNIMYANRPLWTVDTMFYSIMLRKNFAKYLYYVLSKIDMESFNAGAALPSMTTEILSHFKIIVPDNKTLELFDNKIALIFTQIDNLQQQIANLTQQRDLLLPRLMSGKLEVK